MARITFIQHDGTENTVEAEPGMTVMEAAVKNSIPRYCGGMRRCLRLCDMPCLRGRGLARGDRPAGADGRGHARFRLRHPPGEPAELSDQSDRGPRRPQGSDSRKAVLRRHVSGCDQDRCSYHWGRARGLVCRVRARASRRQSPCDRHSRPAGRPMRRALSREAHLRRARSHHGHRSGADRPAHGADQAVRRRVSFQRAGRRAGTPRWRVPPHDRRRHRVRMQGGGDRRGRRVLHPEASAASRHRAV